MQRVECKHLLYHTRAAHGILLNEIGVFDYPQHVVGFAKNELSNKSRLGKIEKTIVENNIEIFIWVAIAQRRMSEIGVNLIARRACKQADIGTVGTLCTLQRSKKQR